MAIDIFLQKEKEKCKVGDFLGAESFLSFFEQKTGIAIDEYGTTRLTTTQVEMLIKCLNESGVSIDFTASDDMDASYLLEGD